VQPYLNSVIQDMRAIIAGERAPGRSPAALIDELSHLLPAKSETGPRFSFDIEGRAAQVLSAEQAAHVLRIAGEAASNVVRHAEAKTASISLTLRDRLIVLEIADDGVGLDSRRSESGGLGLNHIRARASKLGGTLRVDAAPGRGTRISVAFPASQP
jgi:signal transduction histidine kinase